MIPDITMRRADFALALDIVARVGERQSSRARRLRRVAAREVARIIRDKSDEATLISMLYGNVHILFEKD